MEPVFALSEVAQRLGVSVYTLKARLKEANIHGPRPGREMRLTERDIKELVEHMRQRQRGGLYADPAAAKAAVSRMKNLETRRLNRKMQAQLVNLTRE